MMKMMVRCLAISLSALWWAGASATAQQFQPGDVVIAGSSYTTAVDMEWKILWYDGNGQFKGQLSSLENEGSNGVAFSSDGVLYAAQGGLISRIAPNGIATPFYTDIDLVDHLSFARDGTLYASTRNYSSAAAVHVANSGLLARFGLAEPAVAIDLGSDQCTLYYLTRNKLSRVDVCHGVLLADVQVFGDGPGYYVTDYRILPDGSFLVTRALAIDQLDPNGNLLRSYPVNGADHLALDSDGHSVWFSPPGERLFSKLDLTTGAVTKGPFNAGVQFISAMTVFGEPRAALTNGPLAGLPTLSPALLSLLAVLLIGVAFLRVRP